MRHLLNRPRRPRRAKRTVLSAIAVSCVAAVLVALMAGHARIQQGFVLTDASATKARGNTFSDKCQVYLTVRPRSTGSVPGEGPQKRLYYYGVTTDSKTFLLAGPNPPPGVPDTSAKILTVESTGVTIPVQLCPFNDPPHRHGAKAKYKLLVTAVSDWQQGRGTLGFVPDKSKTIEFQIRTPNDSESHDSDEDGDGEGDPHGTSGRPDHGANNGGGGAGGNNGGANNGGGGAGGNNGGGGLGGDPGGGTIGVGPLVTVNKFYDTNVNGVHDLGEPLLTGWKVVVTDPLSASRSFFTPIGVSLSIPGAYRVDEITPQGTWLQTSLSVDGSYANGGLPSQQPQSASLVFNNESHDALFGNVCLGAGGARPLQFWASQTGEAVMNSLQGNMSQIIALLINMNLRDAQGNHFDPASYSHLRTWLLSATSANMAYMLSAQLAALTISTQASAVSQSALVWTGSSSMTVGTLIQAVNEELGLHGQTTLGDPNRSLQENLANTLSQANSNVNFVQARPCAIRY